MKWKVPIGPFEGDTRKRRKFAWFPVFVYNGDQLYKVWLETYQLTEKYEKVAVFHGDYYSYEKRWKVAKREPLFGEYE